MIHTKNIMVVDINLNEWMTHNISGTENSYYTSIFNMIVVWLSKNYF